MCKYKTKQSWNCIKPKLKTTKTIINNQKQKLWQIGLILT